MDFKIVHNKQTKIALKWGETIAPHVNLCLFVSPERIEN